VTALESFNQLTLLDPQALTNPVVDPGASLRDRFAAFHQANPHVFDNLARLALDLKARGASRVGIGMLFEVLRWQYALRTSGDDYRLNNNHRAFYARKLMADVPDLAGMFEVREQRSA